MKRIFTALATAVLVGVVALGATFPTYDYRYRLHLTLEIDGKPYIGSSVIEVSYSCGSKIPDTEGCAGSLGGQATVLDLGSRGMLVATLESGTVRYSNAYFGTRAVFLCANAFGNKSSFRELPLLPRLTGRRNLSPTNFPYLVWFAHPADPKSAKEVTVTTLSDALGPTARFTDAYVEITGDPIRSDIEQALPWLSAMRVEQQRGAMTGRPNQFQLIYSMFVGENS